ncbi:hypothetical protein M427DRAFT_52875 [Gonapodya prolifera JEL478]|uniref:Cytochrome c oxidase assembly protein COX19 n=1 Tax=Gonapodya prolifera (strain JEL478) TaxID=1344416 RepID=A0A139AS09_GONPJ|nr:hypothetical protein M427DRAFT_52875 [Gonapodya prolifera JEL478]|eukprot:KXS19434.1 hypothetical protein M427DRAFT_52875 [Gonapodya prolifera JEL478]
MSFGAPPTTYAAPVAPDLGSFPLDRQGTCKDLMKQYMECLQKNGREGMACRAVTKAYLECRMENGLMRKDDMKALGFWEEPSPSNTR